MDGSGYPAGKKGKDISLFGRILAVCDVYDALMSKRPFREPWPPNDLIEYLMGCAEVCFDYDILSAFLKTISPYPVGAMVALSDNSKAVVVRNNALCILRPTVRILNKQGETEREVNLSTNTRYANITIMGIL
jgi:HD-GYP domain-containing protein (c-di-GMP phosphodiesterase class II)